jgi:hypothetical protein
MDDHSTPAQGEELAGRAPEPLWAPLIAGLITLIPGLLGLATGFVLLFPSLGPTALMQAHTPDHPAARLYNIIVSHLCAMLIGFALVLALGLAQTPSVFELHRLSLPRSQRRFSRYHSAPWPRCCFVPPTRRRLPRPSWSPSARSSPTFATPPRSSSACCWLRG